MGIVALFTAYELIGGLGVSIDLGSLLGG